MTPDNPRRTQARTMLTRRQTLGIAGATGAALVVGRGPFNLRGGGAASPDTAAAASCVLTPEKTEGPYFVDELLNRSDIRSNSDATGTRPGFRFDLTMTVLRIDDDCAPAEGAIVDIWHCDASGSYSNVSQNGTVGQNFLRGYQVADADGKVKFTTIYPGWYSGRAVHIHFKVRTFENDSTTYEFNSQLFFDPTLNNEIQSDSTYDGPGTTSNGQDGIYNGDTEVLMTLSGSESSGFTGAITVGLSGLPASSDNPGGSDSDESVAAKLSSAKAGRNAQGKRVVKAKVSADEEIAAEAELVRGKRVIAKRSRNLAAGNSSLRLEVANGVDPGPATLKLTLTDAAGNRKRLKRTVNLPSG
jgi:protocatechuate 3,4-dioxygenase beta subunit